MTDVLRPRYEIRNELRPVTGSTPLVIRPTAAQPLRADLMPVLVGRGSGSSGTYEHTQDTPATTWVIDHNLNRHVATQLFDSNGVMFLGAIQNTTLNQTVVTLESAASGYAISF